MAKRYLGYGYTNAQGVAKLEYDADGEPLTHSYTGVGAGKMDIVAESGSLQSETYSIIDGTFLDRAISTDYNDTGWTNTNLVSTLNRDDGTKIEQSNTSSYGGRYRTPSSTTNICIEFDVYIADANAGFCSFRNGSTSVKQIYPSNINADVGAWYHLKIKVTDGYYYLNDSSSGTSLSTWNRFFITSSNGNSTRYKNFVIYPI